MDHMTDQMLPHRLDEHTIARMRAAEGSVTDEVDDAMDEPSKPDEGAGAVVWGVIALIVLMAAAAAMGDTLMAWAGEVLR